MRAGTVWTASLAVLAALPGRVGAEGLCGPDGDPSQLNCAPAEWCTGVFFEFDFVPRCEVKCDVADCQNGATSVLYVPPRTCSSPYFGNKQSDCIPGACVCSCTDAFGGDACDTCAEGYFNYPDCEACTSKDHCNNHASYVSDDGARANCACTCLAAYDGGDCGECAEGYINYPDCTQCTSAVHCSGHAASVEEVGRASCVCECRNFWGGDRCETCPQQYGGADCDRCSDAYAGAACDVCAEGHVGYPDCRPCDIKEDCAEHASAVTEIARTTCQCTCENFWTFDDEGNQCAGCPDKYGGAACDRCADKYDGANCDACNEGYFNYPECKQCNSDDHCNNHAASVTDDGTRTSCACTCAEAYTNAKCDACSEGYINYPDCTQCTSAVHCSGHAASVTDDGARASCMCECGNYWTGSQCETCPAKYGGAECDRCADKYEGAPACDLCHEGYINYPDCDACNSEEHCNDHADSATDDGTRQRCVCTCRENYEGATCDKCAAGYINYPDCEPCTVQVHCRDHALKVVEKDRTTCECTCSGYWAGQQCQTCPERFDAVSCAGCAEEYDGEASGCDECSEGHINYPTCQACTSRDHCNDHADAATDNGARSACVCTCAVGYVGATCDACAGGYINYPACEECTDEQHCSGHATRVEEVDNQRCACTCGNKWAGARCETCPEKYGGKNCDRCADKYEGFPGCDLCHEGYINYPDCDACNSEEHCNDHAASVTDDGTRTQCVCTCTANYEGVRCNKCAAGYINYPACDQCSVAVHCSGHATSVREVNRRRCDCDCANQWTGSQCETCPEKFGGKNCDQCADKYEGFPTCAGCNAGYFNYPDCDACNSEDHCNGHAASVTDDGTRSGCSCTCAEGYGGTRCGQCADGYINYPDCVKCNSATHCNGHAASVEEVMNTQCVCTCADFWIGATCNGCPPRYNQACTDCVQEYESPDTSCNRCAEGYFNYPDCARCTSEAHCNDHAESATDNGMRTGCTCTCKKGYTGAKCDKCATGYTGYPDCISCTPAGHCNDHATKARESNGVCYCTCRGWWTGSQCETCPERYGGADCDECATKYDGVLCNECAAGYINYPACDPCTSAKHCNNHAVDVTDDGTRQGCSCTCAPQYTGPTCNLCAPGYVNYPACEQCTVEDNCNDHAVSVAAAGGNQCICECADFWEGDTCDFCPQQYRGPDPDRCATCPEGFDGDMCDRCAQGYVGYPNCRQCTSSRDCNGHAIMVDDDGARSACVCTCDERYAGATCGECAAGYINYPRCTQCSIADDCSGNAVSVVDVGRSACQCNCKDYWEGEKCDYCPPKYRGDRYPEQCNACAAQYAGDKCNACAPGFVNYPYCNGCAPGHVGYPNCWHCSAGSYCGGNAVGATLKDGRCHCRCRDYWGGDRCGSCSPRFQGASCNECAQGFEGAWCGGCSWNEGYAGYPYCGYCSNETNCNNHAWDVWVDNVTDTCNCSCRDPYEGYACESCALGYYDYPNCTLCTNETHCNNNAINVTSDENRTRCVCDCKVNFAGDACGECAEGYTGAACDACDVGYIEGDVVDDILRCYRCNTTVHCSGHASAATSNADNTACVCTCEGNWVGDDCSVCPPEYEGEFCDRCAAGHKSKLEPKFVGGALQISLTCEPCVLGMCGATGGVPHATNITDDGFRDSCVCDCVNSFTGPLCNVCGDAFGGNLCDACAPTRILYPNCTECTLAAHCNSHAVSVTPNGNQTACECTCRNFWVGAACETCGERFGGADCDACAPAYTGADCSACADGFVGYPTCTACNTTIHCNDNADATSSNADRTACECACSEGYTGATCDACADGYVGYPACERCSAAVHCSDHALSVATDVNQTACACTCRHFWTGASCETCEARYENDCSECAAGHIGVAPTCDRCDVAVHCSGNAGNVTDDGTRGFCRCDCRAQWTGSMCETCPARYGGADCDVCADGAFAYPICGSCDAEYCSNHSIAVETDANQTTCNCTCRNQWSGDQCETCGPEYGGDDCDTCAAHYVGYPACRECTIDSDCSGHAVRVSHNADHTACACECAGTWEGADCSVCPVGYGGADCDECAEGWVQKYDPARLVCEACDFAACAVTDEYEHAENVTDDGTRTSCVCECKNMWSGVLCDVCAPEFAGGECDACAEGYAGYPVCELCTAERHCSGHAVAVAPDALQETCACECRNQWLGADCGDCSMNYDVDRDCGACAEGHVAYPNCTRCTIDGYCNGHAERVAPDVDQTLCVCACENQWTGATCDVCPERYAGYHCDRCAKGYINYPECIMCTTDEHCSGNANQVSDDGSNSYCVCSCADRWVGERCEKCPPLYGDALVVRDDEVVSSCAACAPKRFNYPHCTLCTVEEHCNGHAVDVITNAAQTECGCICRNGWIGAACEECPLGYAGHDCDECLVTRSEIYAGYPKCEKVECSVEGQCVPGHADYVTYLDGVCECGCRHGWSGADCGLCLPPHTGVDCDMCMAGYIRRTRLYEHIDGGDVPVAVDFDMVREILNGSNEAAPLNATECGVEEAGENATHSAWNHSVAAMGWFPDGNATSLNVCWADIREDTVNRSGRVLRYNVTTYCAAELNRSAVATADDTGGALVAVDASPPANGTIDLCCALREWEDGAVAKTCCSTEDGLNGTDVANTTVCCTTVHDLAGGNATDCCNYTEFFNGTTWTNCSHAVCEACDAETHCDGRALLAVPNATLEECVCENCTNHWSGYNCSTCPEPYGGAACDCCAEGRVEYPLCRNCSVELDCNANNTLEVFAGRVAADNECLYECTCRCKNMWEGETCDTCPELFDPEQECGACLFEGEYPACLPNTTAPEEVEKAGTAEADDVFCWEPFVGFCFWLAVGGAVCCVCSVCLLGLMKRQRRDEGEDEGNGADGFDKLCEMADQEVVEMMRTVGDVSDARRSSSGGGSAWALEGESGVDPLRAVSKRHYSTADAAKTQSLLHAAISPTADRMDPLGVSGRASASGGARPTEDPLGSLRGGSMSTPPLAANSASADIDDDRFQL